MTEYQFKLDTAADDKDGGHSFNYDFIVIGGGSGGIACAKELGLGGARVALFDYVFPSPPGTKWGLGGTCVNVGCIPKKLMHHSSICREKIDDAVSYGWTTENIKFSWEKLVENVQAHIKGINSGYRRIDLPKHNVQYINELVKFVDAHTIEGVNAKGAKATYTARRFVLAVGGRPVYPDIPGAEHAITSDDLFSLDREPGKTCIIGASYVALECAGFLHGLGYDVTVVVRSILLRGFDQDMAERAGAYMKRNGVKFVRPATPSSIEKLEDGRFKVTWTSSDEALNGTDVFDTVLFAIGRRSETHRLELDKAGFDAATLAKLDGKLETDAGERVVAGPAHFYAIGDIRLGQPELTPLAIAQGKRLGWRLLGRGTKLTDYHDVPTTVFTPLEYGFVGLSEEDAVKRLGEDNVEVWHTNFTPLEWEVPHYVSSMEADEDEQRRPENTCYMKLVCDKSRNNTVVGFHVLCDNAGEITQGMAIAIKLRATKDTFDDIIGIHPTDAEQMTKLKVTKRSGESPLQSTC